MEEIAKLVLSAPALNVALLCVLAALGLLWYRDNRKKSNGNGSEKYAPLWRLERLESDLKSLAEEVREVLPEVSGVKAEVRGLVRLLELLIETHRSTDDNVKLLVDRLKG